MISCLPPSGRPIIVALELNLICNVTAIRTRVWVATDPTGIRFRPAVERDTLAWTRRPDRGPGEHGRQPDEMLTIQLVPNRSTHAPKWSPHGACDNGSTTVPPSARAS